MGYRKKRENKIAKSSSVQKKRRESEKKKVAMPFQKELEKENFSKEYHFHQIYNTHAHLDQICMNCCSL
jgi:hypothetical protein